MDRSADAGRWWRAALGAASLLAGATAEARAQCDGVWRSGDDLSGEVVYDLAVNGDELLAVGQFDGPSFGNQRVRSRSLAGGGPWVALDGGFSAPPSRITVYEGRAVVAGGFRSVGGVVVNNFAIWDGSHWQAMGEGFTGPILTMEVLGGALFAGTAWDDPSSLIGRVLRWNGTAWEHWGGELGTYVRGLAIYDGDVIAGGWFTFAGTVPMNRVGRQRGGAWEALGSGLNNGVNALAVFRGELIAAGRFTTAGGAPAARVARWNGTSWHPLGGGVDAEVFALAVLGDELIAGGTFGTAGGQPASRVARWNGVQWRPLGSGVDADVNALAPAGDTIIVGGRFSLAGGGRARLWATWTPCYANCDCSPASPALNVADFVCFMSAFAAGTTYANCDGSTAPPILTVNDFACFQERFAAGCP